MKRVLVVVGTRPEAIKMAPLVRRLKMVNGMSVAVCSTGQHRELVRQVFELFDIKPEFDLDVMQPNQSLVELSSKVMIGVDDVLSQFKPERVLVHGDTTTTLAATLASYYRKIHVAHVEAGLRTKDIYAPWPEEINRRLTDAVADRLYAPTSRARDALQAEGVAPERILVTGNTVIDALFDVLEGPLKDPTQLRDLDERFAFVDLRKKILLVTCHRRESYGTGFEEICAALSKLAQRDDIQIIFPIHPNPNVRGVFNTLETLKTVRLIEPVDYLEMVYLMSRCHSVLTDSGGIQEEAPSLGKPVLVMRNVTERPEAVEAGTVQLVGTSTDRIILAATEILENQTIHAAMSKSHNPYGDGNACARIVADLLREH
jgi:UDP-N-acetylglucosamine 2-epimerase (non-hydrolysing)